MPASVRALLIKISPQGEISYKAKKEKQQTLFLLISLFYIICDYSPVIMKLINLSMSSLSYAMISNSGISPLEKMFAIDTY